MRLKICKEFIARPETGTWGTHHQLQTMIIKQLSMITFSTSYCHISTFELQKFMNLIESFKKTKLHRTKSSEKGS